MIEAMNVEVEIERVLQYVFEMISFAMFWLFPTRKGYNCNSGEKKTKCFTSWQKFNKVKFTGGK